MEKNKKKRKRKGCAETERQIFILHLLQREKERKGGRQREKRDNVEG